MGIYEASIRYQVKDIPRGDCRAGVRNWQLKGLGGEGDKAPRGKSGHRKALNESTAATW